MTPRAGGMPDTGHRAALGLAFTPAPWRAAACLTAHLLLGGALFALSLAAITLAAVAGQLTAALPLVVGAACVVRGCAHIERGRARFFGTVVSHRYRPVPEDAALGHRIRVLWTDPALWRDCVWLVLFYPPLLLLDVLALAVWLLPLAGVSLPLWFWAVRGGRTDGGLGFRVETLPTSLAVAGVCVLLLFATAPLLTGMARLHLRAAHTVLRGPIDPLTQVKRMLAGPGPLTDWGRPVPDAPTAERDTA